MSPSCSPYSRVYVGVFVRVGADDARVPIFTVIDPRQRARSFHAYTQPAGPTGAAPRGWAGGEEGDACFTVTEDQFLFFLR